MAETGELSMSCTGLVRPDSCWNAALETITVGKLASFRETVAFGGHVAGIVQYVCFRAVDLSQQDKILFGGVDESLAAMLPADPLVGGFLDGVVWNVVINFLKAQVKDPAVMDKLAAWLAGFLK